MIVATSKEFSEFSDRNFNLFFLLFFTLLWFKHFWFRMKTFDLLIEIFCSHNLNFQLKIFKLLFLSCFLFLRSSKTPLTTARDTNDLKNEKIDSSQAHEKIFLYLSLHDFPLSGYPKREKCLFFSFFAAVFFSFRDSIINFFVNSQRKTACKKRREIARKFSFVVANNFAKIMHWESTKEREFAILQVVFFFPFSFRLHVKCKITVAVKLIALTKESPKKKTAKEKDSTHRHILLRRRRRWKKTTIYSVYVYVRFTHMKCRVY